MEPYARNMHPEGFQPLGVYKLPEAIDCMIRLIEWLYQDLAQPEPMLYRNYSPVERNAEIVQRYLAGESSAELAKQFGISDRRIRYILKPATRKL